MNDFHSVSGMEKTVSYRKCNCTRVTLDYAKTCELICTELTFEMVHHIRALSTLFTMKFLWNLVDDIRANLAKASILFLL